MCEKQRAAILLFYYTTSLTTDYIDSLQNPHWQNKSQNIFMHWNFFKKSSQNIFMHLVSSQSKQLHKKHLYAQTEHSRKCTKRLLSQKMMICHITPLCADSFNICKNRVEQKLNENDIDLIFAKAFFIEQFKLKHLPNF